MGFLKLVTSVLEFTCLQGPVYRFPEAPGPTTPSPHFSKPADHEKSTKEQHPLHSCKEEEEH